MNVLLSCEIHGHHHSTNGGWPRNLAYEEGVRSSFHRVSTIIYDIRGMRGSGRVINKDIQKFHSKFGMDGPKMTATTT